MTSEGNSTSVRLDFEEAMSSGSNTDTRAASETATTKDAAMGLMKLFTNMEENDISLLVGEALEQVKNSPADEREAFRTSLENSELPRKLRRMRLTNSTSYDSKPLRSGLVRYAPRCNEVATAILRNWVKGNSSLRNAAVNYLGQSGTQNAGLDFSHKRFLGTWSFSELKRGVNFVVDRNRDFDIKHVALMLCCLSGKYPVKDSEGSEVGLATKKLEFDNASPKIAEDRQQSEGRFAGTIFESWIRDLKALAIEDADWDLARDFVDTAANVVQEKESERRRSVASEFSTAIASVRSKFAGDLRYLERYKTIREIQPSSTINLSELTSALSVVEELATGLEAYQEIRPQAPNRSAELERSVTRTRAEACILSIIDRISRAVSNEDSIGKNASSDASEMGEPLGDDESGDHGGLVTNIHTEAINCNASSPSLNEAVDSGIEHGDIDEEKQISHRNLEAELLALQEGHQEVLDHYTKSVGEIRDLRLDKEALSKSVDQFKQELFRSQQKYSSLRLSYIALAQNQDGANQESSTDGSDIEDVKTAIQRAHESFQGRLLFALNSKSERNPPFRNAKAVWRALAWLATDYYDSRCRGFDGIDSFDVSIREACGWWYKPKQSDSAKAKYSDYYTTKDGDTTYVLDEHIGRGSGGDPRYMIRIAFDWDKDQRKVVVGYIGRHQRTDAS